VTTDLLKPRRFGRSSLETPPIAVGCAPLGDMPETFGYSVSEQDALATVRAALASPIDYLDTAGWYGDGESKRRIGLVLRELGGLPSGAVLETKVGRSPDSSDFSGETIRRRFERSMALLGVDHFDAVFLHGPEMTTFAEAMAPGGPIEVLRGYYEQGVFDHFGVASDLPNVDLEYLKTGLFDAVISANRYTLLNTNADAMIDYASTRGIAVLNAAPYGSGILSRGPRSYPRYSYRQAPQLLIDRALQIEAICERYEIPLAAAALQFSLRDPRISVTIVGMSRPERIEETLKLAVIDIPDAVWDEIRALGPPQSVDPLAEPPEA
jgi:D-threo-aldose 1-dehydrogenase